MTFGPAIRLHCWGGYGSQLLALAFALDLTKSIPGRNVVIVFHSNGVSHRPLEIGQLLGNLRFRELDDFPQSKMSKEVQTSKRVPFVKLVKKVLTSMRIVLTDENLKEPARIFPWTLEIRGHYSYRKISNSTLEEITRRILTLNNPLERTADILVHYRLGDLLILDSKSFVPGDLLTSLIQDCMSRLQSEPQVLIATENPSEARSFLKLASNSKNVEFANYDPTSTIKLGLASQIFIGSNSKLSLWISILRAHRSSTQVSYLPSSLVENLEAIFSGDFSQVKSYL